MKRKYLDDLSGLHLEKKMKDYKQEMLFNKVIYWLAIFGATCLILLSIFALMSLF